MQHIDHYSRASKAAIVVQALLREGQTPPLARLPEDVQVRLTHEISNLRLVDRATVNAVVSEFIDELEGLGLAAPTDMEGTLAAVAQHLSPGAAARLRSEAAARVGSDPWAQIRTMKSDELAAPLTRESIEIAAVILSRLPVNRAAEALSLIPGDRARRVALAFSRANHVSPLALHRIGQAIVRDYCAVEAPAFDRPPDQRVGAILNASTQRTRDSVLKGLGEDDPAFADQVRKAIFTYAHIPARLHPTDVPKILRKIDPPDLALVIAAADADTPEAQTTAYLLANIPQRLADSLREEAAALDAPRKSEVEKAMGIIVSTLREAADQGEISLMRKGDEDEDA
ncbi:flagellar motor switch protein FliG [Ketogulonicigenium robustum]|uniref:flagellar motor switch protein FliG n=1 Tax=Ketogulonicigenium robustum TaxID=92947 RepID=UPI0018DC45CA|nr:FliG C-terminal domain-containing protein [Ketogulonicigenium robustum]